MKNLIVTSKSLAPIREAIVKGMEISSGAKSSATHYHKKEDQVAAVKKAVESLYLVSKEIPLLLANQRGATGFFVQEVIKNELKKTAVGGACKIVNPLDWDAGLGSFALVRALKQLEADNGITYVLRLFDSYRDEKINNARSAKMTLRFILGHENLEFMSIKYHQKLRSILRHVWGNKLTPYLLNILEESTYKKGTTVYANEKDAEYAKKNFERYCLDIDRSRRLVLFLFGRATAETFRRKGFDLMDEYYKAKINIDGCKRLPEEVIVGMLSDEKHPQHEELWSTPDKREATVKKLRATVTSTTANQQVRQTKANKEMGVVKEVQVQKVTDFLALYKTGYESGWTDDLKAAIDRLAQKKRLTDLPYQNIGIVVDRSKSMTGNENESKNTPRAIASFTALVLAKSTEKSIVEETDGDVSDVADAFIRIVEHGNADIDAIFVISDGYENSYDGLLSEVIKSWRELTENEIPVYHLSPITGSEVGAKVRSFGPGISTVAISKPESLMAQVNNKLLEQDTKKWLERQFKALEKESARRLVTAE